MTTQLFLQKTPYLLLHLNNFCSPSQKLLETSTFYHIFNSFTVEEMYNISNKYQRRNNLTTCLAQKTLYFSFISKLSWLSPSQKFFETSTFYHIFIILTVIEDFHISSKYRLPNKSAKKRYLHKTPNIPPSFQKTICVAHCKSFLKHPLFTRFSLFLPVSEVCNISSKYWLGYKLAWEIFLHKTPYIPFLSFLEKFCSPWQKLLETSTFYHIFTSFHSGWSVQYFK